MGSDRAGGRSSRTKRFLVWAGNDDLSVLVGLGTFGLGKNLIYPENGVHEAGRGVCEAGIQSQAAFDVFVRLVFFEYAWSALDDSWLVFYERWIGSEAYRT